MPTVAGLQAQIRGLKDQLAAAEGASGSVQVRGKKSALKPALPTSNHTTGVENRTRFGGKPKAVAEPEPEHDSGSSSSSSGSSGSSNEDEGQGSSRDSSSEGDDDGASERDGSVMYCKIGFNPI